MMYAIQAMPCSFCNEWINATEERPISKFRVRTELTRKNIRIVLKPGDNKCWIKYDWAQLRIYSWKERGVQKKVELLVCDTCEEYAIERINYHYGEGHESGR